MFEKKYFREDLRGNRQKHFVTLTIFCPLRGPGMWNWVNPLKKENLRQKSFSDNVVY